MQSSAALKFSYTPQALTLGSFSDSLVERLILRRRIVCDAAGPADSRTPRGNRMYHSIGSISERAAPINMVPSVADLSNCVRHRQAPVTDFGNLYANCVSVGYRSC